MAGAGYKLFNTGDVLTAAQVNTYLMEQTVMVFANAAARTTALTGVVSEGMISYLKDTNAVEVYDGSNWVSSDDPNAIQNTIVDAKGDLIAASAADTPARLAVGNNGETLVADSSTSTGLRWQADWNTGKNKVINGDFGIWQRGTSFSAGVYCADRFINDSDGTCTATRETFTPGSAPVSGYESQYFLRQTRTATGTYQIVAQKIEDVRTAAGVEVTLSFWAKANANVTNQPNISQNFGSGGSAQVTTSAGSQTITTSWQRFSYTVTLASVSGKTIGTGSNLEIRPIRVVTNTAHTIDLWGVQLEIGAVATPFTTATGTLAGELAACQRYYVRFNSSSVYTFFCNGNAYSTTLAPCILPLPVTLRTAPSSIETSGTASHYRVVNGSTATTCSAVPSLDQAATQALSIIFTVASGLTVGQAINAGGNNTASAYIGVSAEL